MEYHRMIPVGQDWPRAYIRAVLAARGKTLRGLSREANLADDTLRNALDKHWPKGERIIANACGVTPEVIWPSRFKAEVALDPDLFKGADVCG